jgi:hypothetical protein
MKIYHSFWDNGFKKFEENLYSMHKLSALTALKNYGNIHLITTPRGKDFLGNIPYTSIEFFDEIPDIKYSKIWALGKIHAYKQICEKNEPFLHIDYDVFLFKKFSNKILKSRVLFQHVEDDGAITEHYDVESFKTNCPYKPYFNYDVRYAHNVGIFGGNDINVLKFCVDAMLDVIYNPLNDKFFTHFNQIKYGWGYSVLIEQLYLSMCLEYLKVKANHLFNGWPIEEEAKKVGYTHLMGKKNDIKVIEKVIQKINKLENIV